MHSNRAGSHTRLPRQLYLPRVLGLGLGGVAMGAALWEQGAPRWVWLMFVLGAVVWPHVAYQLSTHASAPDRVEILNLLLDSALAGFGIYAIGGQYRAFDDMPEHDRHEQRRSGRLASVV